jgi:LasA protease
MKAHLSVAATGLTFKPGRKISAWFVFFAMLLIPALACNMPPRQPGGLVFPTSPPQITSVELPFETGEATPFPALPAIPTFTVESVVPSQTSYPFWGLQTATPGAGLPGAWSTPAPGVILPAFTYWTQPGDTLQAVAARFGVSPDQVSPAQPTSGLLTPGQVLTIPNLLGEPPYSSALLPDSVIIYSIESAHFQIDAYIEENGGYLSSYREEVDPGESLTGAEIIQRLATENSINPKLLLAFLEFRSGWVRGQPFDPALVDYPIGFHVPDYHGLYMELSLVAKELNIGYYDWRQGTLMDLIFPDNSYVRISPGLNAGSAALETLTSKFYLRQQDWLEALHGPQGLLNLYSEMFGNPWTAAGSIEPIFPPGMVQPNLELPFAPGERWSLTAGPHIAWRTGTPRGALDFAPITGEPPCSVSTAWVTASAPGLVVRSERGVVSIDLDGDGLEQTGWVLVYLHLAEQDRVSAGTWVLTDAPLGHPSCEGGQATGTNVHLARKYNGEWVAADGPLPMVLSGWTAHAGELAYDGTLEKDGQIVSARPNGSSGSTIIR